MTCPYHLLITPTDLSSWNFNGYMETDNLTRYEGMLAVIGLGFLAAVGIFTLTFYVVVINF